MSALDIIVQGSVYSLSDLTKFAWMADTNFGMPPIERFIESLADQHGAVDYGFRLLPRRFGVRLFINADDGGELDNRRDELLRILSPLGKAAVIRKCLDNGSIRHIDAFTTGGATFDRQDRQGWVQVVVIEFVAPDPTWYDPTGAAISYGLGGGGTGFAVPSSIPSSIGSSAVNMTIPIIYSGSWLTYPQIRLTGPLTDCVVANLATGEKLDFTGTTIANGDYYDIDCRYGYKTVKDLAGASKIAKLTDDSDLATFHIAPTPEAADGINALNIAASGITSVSNIDIAFLTRYIGV